jgi:hypothetical protein
LDDALASYNQARDLNPSFIDQQRDLGMVLGIAQLSAGQHREGLATLRNVMGVIEFGADDSHPFSIKT